MISVQNFTFRIIILILSFYFSFLLFIQSTKLLHCKKQAHGLLLRCFCTEIAQITHQMKVFWVEEHD